MTTTEIDKDYIQLISLGSQVMCQVNPIAWTTKQKAASWIVDSIAEMRRKFDTDKEITSVATGGFELSMNVDTKEDGTYFFDFTLNQHIVSIYDDNAYEVGDYAGYVWSGSQA